MEKIKPFEQEYPLSSFIGAYYIDQRICDKILQYCEDNEHLKKETELKNVYKCPMCKNTVEEEIVLPRDQTIMEEE